MGDAKDPKRSPQSQTIKNHDINCKHGLIDGYKNEKCPKTPSTTSSKRKKPRNPIAPTINFLEIKVNNKKILKTAENMLRIKAEKKA